MKNASKRLSALALGLCLVAGLAGCAPAGYVQWAVATGGHAKTSAALKAEKAQQQQDDTSQ